MLAVLEGWAVMGRPQQTLLQLPVLVTSHQWPGHWSNNNSARPPLPRYGGGGMYEWGYNAHLLPSNCCWEAGIVRRSFNIKISFFCLCSYTFTFYLLSWIIFASAKSPFVHFISSNTTLPSFVNKISVNTYRKWLMHRVCEPCCANQTMMISRSHHHPHLLLLRGRSFRKQFHQVASSLQEPHRGEAPFSSCIGIEYPN